MSPLPNVRLQRARREHILCVAIRAPFCPAAERRLVRSPHAAPAAEERLSKQQISLPHTG